MSGVYWCEWLQSSDPVDVRSEMTGAVASDSATHVYSTSFDPSAACDDGRHHDSLPLISFRVALTRNATTVSQKAEDTAPPGLIESITRVLYAEEPAAAGA